MLYYETIANVSLREQLKSAVRSLWTHTSTAIEGNEETTWVLSEGTGIEGKDVYDQMEVINYAKAIDGLHETSRQEQITEKDIFTLHSLFDPSTPRDMARPVGEWKTEDNYIGKVEEGKQLFIETDPPDKVPGLMQKLLEYLDSLKPSANEKELVHQFAFIHNVFVKTHPLADGNGRMARLIANIPILKAGVPPIVILKEDRREYMQLLANVDLADHHDLRLQGNQSEFENFISQQWESTATLFRAAKEKSSGGRPLT